MNVDITKLRRACRSAAETLQATGMIVRAGMTTGDINDFVHNDTLHRGGIPAPLNYHGFPRSCCTSVNDVVCHGIPGPYVLQEGDIVNVDVTTIVDGHFGDTNATFTVGTCSVEAVKLVLASRLATLEGITAIRPGLPLGVVGKAIEAYVEARGYSVVREYGGHGIGTLFHASPHVNHFANDDGPVLHVGDVFTIEPMVNVGERAVILGDDGWTVRTADGSLSAQAESTVLVTDDGCEVLTTP